MVAGALQFAEHPAEAEAERDSIRMCRGIPCQDTGGSLVDTVQLVVLRKYRCRLHRVLIPEGLLQVAEHPEHDGEHFLHLQFLYQFLVKGFHRTVTHETGYAVRIVPDPLQVTVDLEHGQGEPQVHRHRRIKGYEILDIAVYLQLEGIHPALADDNLLGYGTVQVEDSLPGLLHLVIDQSPHLVDFMSELGKLGLDEFHHGIVLFLTKLIIKIQTVLSLWEDTEGNPGNALPAR